MNQTVTYIDPPVLSSVKRKYSDELKTLLPVILSIECSEFQTNELFSKEGKMFGRIMKKKKGRRLYKELETNIQTILSYINSFKSEKMRKPYLDELNKLIIAQKKICECLIPGECDLEKLDYVIETKENISREIIPEETPTDKVTEKTNEILNSANEIIMKYENLKEVELKDVLAKLNTMYQNEINKLVDIKREKSKSKGSFSLFRSTKSSNEEETVTRIIKSIELSRFLIDQNIRTKNEMVGGKHKTLKKRHNIKKRTRRH
jgi:hypothetical protein